ncbi:MAG: class I SAM-dependent rRNA methyltransferase [Bacteroidetes bacterium]|nr:class I SAM-dependent rRNA methyltransferase [Bacteroidota bacterium]
MQEASVILKPGKEQAVRRGHPWIFSGAVKKVSAGVAEGDTVQVFTHDLQFIGTGFWGNASIAVRLMRRTPGPLDQDFWNEVILNAWNWRRRMGLAGSRHTNCFRLIHGEGDGLPGLIVDVYGTHAVVQPHHEGMLRAADKVAEALKNLKEAALETIYLKATGTLPGATDIWLMGNAAGAEVMESGIRYRINWVEGQKTGFFLDQRPNRDLLAAYASGCSVLNAFSYTGGFSMAALSRGATRVLSVDVSQKALDLAASNAILNGWEERHEVLCADVPKFLKEQTDQFDIVVLDPPAFAKSIQKRHNAVMAYKRLNAAGFQAVKPGGLLFTFSCSQVVDRELFRHTITAAGLESGRSIRILHELSQGPDHPVNLFHPEGAYLKGLVLAVD